MISNKASLFFLCSIFAICRSGFVNNMHKCSIHDGECQKELFQTVLRDIGKSGIPELGIPPTDPFVIQNVSVSILNMVEITMLDGVAKGVKDCIVEKFDTHIEEGRSTLELVCDLNIKGKYKLVTLSPLVKGLMGGSTIMGEGVGRVKLEKLRMKFNYHFYIENLNGDLFIRCIPKDLKYENSLGKVTFAANNIYLGDQEASGLVIGMLNDNWKFIMDTFGKPFLDKAMDIIYVESHKFFDVIPTKYYLTDDLSKYVKN